MSNQSPLLAVTDCVEPQPRWRELTATCYVPSALSFFSYGFGTLAFPLICQNWDIPIATVAYLKSVAEIAETVFSLPASSAAIHYGAKGSLMLGSFGYTLSTVGLATAPGVITLAFSYFLQSGAIKIYNRGRSLIIKDVPKTFYGRTNGYLILLRCIFMSVAPLALSMMLWGIGNVQHVFLVQTILGVLMMVSIFLDREPSSHEQHETKTKKRTKTDPSTEKAQSEVSYSDTVVGERRVVLARTVGLCSCISMLIGAYNILLPVATVALGLPISYVALSMTLCYAVAGGFSVLGGKVVDKFGARKTMLAAMLLLSAGHLTLGILSSAHAGAVPCVLGAAAVCLGLGDALASPLRGVLKNTNADCVKKWAQENGKDEKAAIAKSFGILDIMIDVVGVFYPIGLGLCATYLSAACASIAFAMIGLFAALWVCCGALDLN